MRGNGSGKYSPQATPRLISRSPRRELFDPNVWVCQKKRRRQAVPDREPAEVGKVQIVPTCEIGMSKECRPRIAADLQRVAIQCLNRNPIRVIYAACVGSSKSREPKRLCMGTSLCNDVLQ